MRFLLCNHICIGCKYGRELAGDVNDAQPVVEELRIFHRAVDVACGTLHLVLVMLKQIHSQLL